MTSSPHRCQFSCQRSHPVVVVAVVVVVQVVGDVTAGDDPVPVVVVKVGITVELFVRRGNQVLCLG